MYRKRNGSLGFSFTRFANAAVPNFFEDPSPSQTADLTSQRRDMLYMHQIVSQDCYALDLRSFYVAGVAESEGISKKIHKALRKYEILNEDNTVNTHKIGSRFTHQLAFLNVYRQRELVGLLFWWEEEHQRLKKLEAEEHDLDGMILDAEQKVSLTVDDSGTKEMLDQLKFARERVRMKKRQRPSQRRQDVEEDRDDIVLAFHGRSKSVPQIGTPANRDGSQPERPPQYFAGA